MPTAIEAPPITPEAYPPGCDRDVPSAGLTGMVRALAEIAQAKVVMVVPAAASNQHSPHTSQSPGVRGREVTWAGRLEVRDFPGLSTTALAYAPVALIAFAA